MIELWMVILLIVVGFTLIFCEIFVPGGILGIIGAFAVVGSIVGAFFINTATGAIFLLISVVGLITVGFAAFKLLPKTGIGKKVFRNIDAENLALLLASIAEGMLQYKKFGIFDEVKISDNNFRQFMLDIIGNGILNKK